MRELTLILTDLYLDRDACGDQAAWPRLAALEAALARGDLAPSPDWRDWVWRRIGLPRSPRMPIAAIARSVRSPPVDSERDGQWWLAQAVHLEAGVDRVYLHAESPTLSAEEWRELERGFNQVFSAARLRLVDGHGAQAYVLSASEIDADTIDPARVRGADILPALPLGAAGAVLKRLMTEIQMWLHAHPVNIARQERGAVPANGLWIWGGGKWPPQLSTAALPELRSDDGFLRGLWQIANARGEPVPPSFEALDRANAEAMIVALPGPTAASEMAAQGLSSLERDWFQPALASLRRGRIQCLQMHVNDRLLSLTRRASWRWWRRARPWYARLT